MARPERSKDSDLEASENGLERTEKHLRQTDQLLALFPILQGKSPEELQRLNRTVLRKLDWQFLPCVTMMLLMR